MIQGLIQSAECRVTQEKILLRVDHVIPEQIQRALHATQVQILEARLVIQETMLLLNSSMLNSYAHY
ncbi:hypothetical protein D3C86_2189910 [compost metagenome]